LGLGRGSGRITRLAVSLVCDWTDMPNRSTRYLIPRPQKGRGRGWDPSQPRAIPDKAGSTSLHKAAVPLMPHNLPGLDLSFIGERTAGVRCHRWGIWRFRHFLLAPSGPMFYIKKPTPSMARLSPTCATGHPLSVIASVAGASISTLARYDAPEKH
jgi:hypothetical protein